MWEARFKALIEWKMVHGHCVVPIAQGELGTWVSKQRQQKKRGKLGKDKVDMLQRIGFVWSTAEADWDEKYRRLELFKSIHGHVSVPFNAGDLGWWVNTQRQAKRKGKLSREREIRLDRLGFVWQPQGVRNGGGNNEGCNGGRKRLYENADGALIGDYHEGRGDFRYFPRSASPRKIVENENDHVERVRFGRMSFQDQGLNSTLLLDNVRNQAREYPISQQYQRNEQHRNMLSEENLANHGSLYQPAARQASHGYNNEAPPAATATPPLPSYQPIVPPLPSHNITSSHVTTPNNTTAFSQHQQKHHQYQQLSGGLQTTNLRTNINTINNNPGEYQTLRDQQLTPFSQRYTPAPQDVSYPSSVMSSFEQSNFNRLTPSPPPHYQQQQQKQTNHHTRYCHHTSPSQLPSIDQDVQSLQRFLDEVPQLQIHHQLA